MHSSIQFRHKAISTYGWRRLRSLWLFRSNTLLADSDMCWSFFSLWGEICRWKLVAGSWKLGSSSILGLDCVSLVVLLQVVCLLQLVSQTVSPVCHWEGRSPTQTGQKWSGSLWSGERKGETHWSEVYSNNHKRYKTHSFYILGSRF